MKPEDIDIIFSTRCKTWRGRRAIRLWIKKHSDGIWWPSPESRGLEDLKYSYVKLPSLIYLDDRAMRFTGTFPTALEIHRAKPWNKL
jgi:hypothetical protein